MSWKGSEQRFRPARRLVQFTGSGTKKLAGVASVVALGVLVGCGGGAPSTLLSSMSGTWVFTMTPTSFPSDVIQAKATLTQTGSAVDGQVMLGGNYSGCGTAAVMSGTVTGSSLALQLTQSQSTLTLTGSVNNGFTTASGTYTATVGQCLQNGGTGTWSATTQ